MGIKIKPESIGKILILLGMLASLSYISKQLKMQEHETIKEFNENSIEHYLLEHNDILKSNKPILWVHIPRELNARKWCNFGSPNSENLNMPYIYLTVRTIIEKCSPSFTICLIDDDSFAKLLPGWGIEMDKLKNPILDNVRTMGLLKLIYLYGGVLCPKSFLCQQDMIDLYNLSSNKQQLIAFEKKNKGIHNAEVSYVPDIRFIASYPQNETVKQLSNYMEELISTDNTQETQFLERIGMECEKYVKAGKMSKQCGKMIGVKKTNGKEVLIEDLMSSDFIEFQDNKMGLYIPEINKRKYEWFVYLNAHEIMSSDTTIGKQILLTLGEELVHQNVIKDTPQFELDKNIMTQNMSKQEMKEINNANVGYWETPLGAPVWGLKPIHLGDHLLKK